ncbi:hypothetical protein COY07_05490 [Candidatus Peregrinibacteria bacterium CG_4_10_14_0_2_um_filter_43_11]|nr:MAG: hypothetical protein COY07_05490 [Candidatus Peregrinibacteria bacterium CG_4_10_14_0_2_um_filter_43_11]
MLKILIVIAPLFLIIFGAAAVQRFKKTDEHWSEVLNGFALHVGLPALIFAALSRADFSFAEEKGLIAANSLFLIGGFVVAFILGKILRLKPSALRTFFICLVFAN